MENVAAGYKIDYMRPRFDRLANRQENGLAPRAVAAHQLFQTPPEIAARLVALLAVKPGDRVLEPSAGLGRILDALAGCGAQKVVAVEIASQCARELFTQNRPSLTIKQRDFLTLSSADIGYFDAIAMNPPFTMRSDIQHIEHALKFLKPGGTLAAVCMDTHHRHEAFKATAKTWEPLPPGTFKNEGTDAPTVLFSIKHNETET
jgi:predicted RNA methylase